MKNNWKGKDWNPDIPIEVRFKHLLMSWKKQNQKLGELKSYIQELEYKLKNKIYES